MCFFVKPTMQGVYAKTELCLLDVISCSRIIRALSLRSAFCVRKYLRHTWLLCLFSLTLFIWQLEFKGCEVPIYMFVTPLSQVTVVQQVCTLSQNFEKNIRKEEALSSLLKRKGEGDVRVIIPRQI